MNKQPIGPTGHTGLDLGFAAASLLAPSVLNLKGSARTLCYVFGGSTLLLSAITAQPYAVKPVVPFKIHGAIDAGYIPSVLLLPALTGALKKPKATGVFVSLFALALGSFLLTNYKANENGQF